MLSTSTAKPMQHHEDFTDTVPPGAAAEAPDLPPMQADFENTTVANTSMFEMIDFRQPPLKEHLEKTTNEMIGNIESAKIEIFTKLCDVLCDSNPATLHAREMLHEYATKYLLDHLLDINPTRVDGNQSKLVVEALARVLTNENEVCTIFEAMEKYADYVSCPLYEEGLGHKRIVTWAKKMSFHEEEELSDVAQNWMEDTIKDPSKIFEHLARGHITSLSKTVDENRAKISFKLAHQALSTVSKEQNRTKC